MGGIPRFFLFAGVTISGPEVKVSQRGLDLGDGVEPLKIVEALHGLSLQTQVVRSLEQAVVISIMSKFLLAPDGALDSSVADKSLTFSGLPR